MVALTFNYYTNVSAGANVSAAREVQIGRLPPTTATANLSANLMPRRTSNGSNRTTPSRPRFSAGS
jgi:hypothetical protein